MDVTLKDMFYKVVKRSVLCFCEQLYFFVKRYFQSKTRALIELTPEVIYDGVMLRRADALAHPDLRGILDSIRIAPSLPPSYPTRARPFIHKTFLLCSQIFSFFLARTML